MCAFTCRKNACFFFFLPCLVHWNKFSKKIRLSYIALDLCHHIVNLFIKKNLMINDGSSRHSPSVSPGSLTVVSRIESESRTDPDHREWLQEICRANFHQSRGSFCVEQPEVEWCYCWVLNLLSKSSVIQTTECCNLSTTLVAPQCRSRNISTLVDA